VGVALHAIAATLLIACALVIASGRWGNVLFGSALCALAIWLACFDVARRTVRGAGVSRYVAVCLLGGYAWLAVAGAAWIGMAQGAPTRDVALHALGLGFLFSMIFGHAPIVLPAVTRLAIRFNPVLYAPLAVLHASLVLRVAGGATDPVCLRVGALGNAIAIVSFIVTMVALAVASPRASSIKSQAHHANTAST
jgi:hypothetical protein